MTLKKITHNLLPKVLPFFCVTSSRLHVSVWPFDCPEEVDVTIHWLLKYYPCHNEYNNIEVSKKCFLSYHLR